MHIYEKLSDGKIIPQHFVEMTSRPGELRPSRITDFKKMVKSGRKVSPSVTTILDVFNKPALINWKIDQHLKVARDHAWAVKAENASIPEIDDYIKEVKRRTELEMDKAPSLGTDFHKDMEDFISAYQDATAIKGKDAYKLCQSVAALIYEKTGKPVRFWQSEVNVFSDLGYAGQCDLFIPRDFDSQDTHSWVIDYKTKQFAHQFKDKNGKKKKLAYGDSHCAQLAAYGMELEPSGLFRAANIFVCLETGEIEWHEWSSEEITKWFEYFQMGLSAWQIKFL
jgi:hypothetical protein